MTAQFWTTNGSDIWRMRRVFEFRNLENDEVVTCTCVSEVEGEFTPVTMPKIKKKRKYKKRTEKDKLLGRGSKSKYKGVKPSHTPGKFMGQVWDKKNKKNVHLGTFDGELLAAAAYQEHIGNNKEAKRLRNEYEEGNCQPEVSDLAMSPSEE